MSKELEIEGYLDELKSLENCFNEMIMAKGHKMTFQLSGSISSISKSIKSFFKDIDEARKTFVVLNDNNQPENYVYDSDDKGFCEKYDPTIDLKPTQRLGFKIVSGKEEDASEYENQLNQRKIKVQLPEVIDMVKIKDLSEEGVFDGINISPLFQFFS